MGDTNKINGLKTCFIAYADILGYSERIKKYNNNYESLNEELEDFKIKILHPQINLIDSIEALRGSVSFFSDSVFVHVPIASESPRFFSDGRVYICIPIEDLASYQFDLAINNIFIRGCATVNYGYLDKTIAFGPGMIDAVECEKKAKYPRICLTDHALKPIRHYIDNGWPGDERISKFVLYGDDKRFFINYLQTIIDFINNSCEQIPEEMTEYPLYNNVPESIDLMKKHKENIENNLKNPDVSEKFSWLANYHNYFCSSHFEEIGDLIILDHHEKFTTISPKNQVEDTKDS
jgi:hypothetical protein